jgi:hypothetical protein
LTDWLGGGMTQPLIGPRRRCAGGNQRGSHNSARLKRRRRVLRFGFPTCAAWSIEPPSPRRCDGEAPEREEPGVPARLFRWRAAKTGVTPNPYRSRRKILQLRSTLTPGRKTRSSPQRVGAGSTPDVAGPAGRSRRCARVPRLAAGGDARRGKGAAGTQTGGRALTADHALPAARAACRSQPSSASSSRRRNHHSWHMLGDRLVIGSGSMVLLARA